MSEKKMFVKVLANWISEADLFTYLLRFTEDRQGRWKNLQLTLDDEEADFFAVINSSWALKDASRTIVFHMEPREAVRKWGAWATPVRANFLQVRDHDHHLNNLEWHLASSYAELREQRSVEKTLQLSAIISSKYFDPGHLRRVDFLRFVQTRNPQCVDIYGTCAELGFENYKGSLPPFDKSAALQPYAYHFAAENHREHNYITEKVVDAILSECVCFYWGAPNVLDVLGDAVIPIALDNFEQDYQLICQTISQQEHLRRLPAIWRAKELILERFQLFPTLYAVLNTYQHCRKMYCLNLERRRDRKEQMMERFKAADLGRVEFWPAVDGRTHVFDAPTLQLFQGNDFGYKRGVMACALGHYAMWQQLVQDESARDSDFYFILEDDTNFFPEFTDSHEFLIAEMYEKDPSWDMLYLSYTMTDANLTANWHLYRKIELGQTCALAPLNLHLYIGGFFAYLITKAGARKLCAFIQQHGIRHGIDYLPKRYGQELGLRMYESQYHLAHTQYVRILGSGDTDIQLAGTELSPVDVYETTHPWRDVEKVFQKINGKRT